LEKQLLTVVCEWLKSDNRGRPGEDKRELDEQCV